MENRVYQIAVLKGDGIGPEVVDESIRIVETLEREIGQICHFIQYPCGAQCYVDQGDPLPESTLEGCRQAEAILLGAMGLPDVRWPDGTEMRPQVDLRFQLDLYAGVRPIYLYNPDHTPLKRMDVGDIDLVILRENVEGLFASMNAGIELRGQVAVDSMVITKSGTERAVKYAFELSTQRNKSLMKVTCVDKANVFKSMAFFRDIYDQVAQDYPEVTRDYAYIDAMALYMVQQPDAYDVIVTENMYGDILSDLAAGLVGGMGMAPSADIGEDTAVFQPSHGTAPDIAGQGIANPVGTILSVSMMLKWLGQRYHDQRVEHAAALIETAVRQVMEMPGVGTPDLGGQSSTIELGQKIADHLSEIV
ncbi:3-isopropylmalate dehydrogenase [Candidatus Poribacteria bacterium]|nr:3-isopropylmalate dehydrogenase [Candidatus Poribacteria bacterium]